MFTAAEIQLIRAHCPSDFDALLRELSVSVDWSGDEYRVYEKLDDDISRRLSEQMKSSSVTAGYMTLLKLGGVPCDYSDTDNELLAKIVANKNKILRGLETLPKFVETEETHTISPQPKPPSTQTRMQTVTKEEHFTLAGPIILGVILIVAGVIVVFNFDSTVGGAVLAVLGLMSATAGIRGKTVRTTSSVPVTEKVPDVPQPVKKATPVRKEIKPPFTSQELQKILDMLTQVDKIVRAI